MASKERLKTKYPGVWYADQNGVRTFYINYRKPGDRKKIEEKLGTSAQNWSAAKASAERTKRINGEAMTNAERRKSKQASKQAELENPTINHLWALYLESRGNEVKGINNDKNRYQLHIEKSFGNKKPRELAPLDVDRLKQQVKKNHSVGTVRNVLELLRRIINFGVRQQLCPPLTWTIQLPKVDPDSTRIEPLTEEQFQKLHEVWETYHDRHIVNIHRFIAWTGSRPSEPLKLLWKDVDLSKGIYTKRKTKSGQSPMLPMGSTIRRIFEEQRRLLDTCPEIMRNSPYVFPNQSGGERRLDSYKRHFQRIRDLAGIPHHFRPNYCLRDTMGTTMLSNSATEAEVGHQLGHAPGSPMTRRYAKFTFAAEQSIVNKAEQGLDSLLKHKAD